VNNVKRDYRDLLAENKIISQAGGKGGERIKKNGFAGMRGDDDFWNLETEPL
jgi:hypothetical protein